MAHELEAMFFRGEVPWHGLGTPVTGALTTEQAIVAAGLNWTVSKERLKTADGIETDGYATRRSDTGAVLGVRGPLMRVGAMSVYYIRCRDCGHVTEIFPGRRWTCCGSCRSIEYDTVELVEGTDDEWTEV